MRTLTVDDTAQQLMNILNDVSYKAEPYMDKKDYHYARNNCKHMVMNYHYLDGKAYVAKFEDTCWGIFASYQRNRAK